MPGEVHVLWRDEGESSDPFEGFPDVISNHLVLWNNVKAVEVRHWRGIEEE